MEIHSAIFCDVDGLLLFLAVSHDVLLPTFFAQIFVTIHLQQEIEQFYPDLLSLYKKEFEKQKFIQIEADANCLEFAEYAQLKSFSLGQIAAISHGVVNRVKIITGDRNTFKILSKHCPDLVCDARSLEFHNSDTIHDSALQQIGVS